MADNMPLVSIGMPVYNGERYIRQALDSLLAQDYENFELIISDNASTDGTLAICREYAAKDSRITIYSNRRNLGPAVNFRTVLAKAYGQYFMWASDDDLWKPSFLSELVGLLEATPSAVLAVCRAEKIDCNGLPLHLGPRYFTTTSMTRAERLCYYAQHASGWLLHSLYRTKIARMATSMFLDKRLAMAASDVLFLHKCIDRGDLIFTEKVLFYKRQTIPRGQDEADSTKFSKMLRVLFWHCYGAFFKCYHFSGMSLREVALVYWAIIQGLPQRSFCQHARKALRRITPKNCKINKYALYLLRKVKSALTDALASRYIGRVSMTPNQIYNKHRDILVIGYYGHGNFGDDLITVYVLSLICRTVSPERIFVRAPEGSYVEKWFPGVQCLSNPQLYRFNTQGIRKVIFGGGGQFFAFPPATFYSLWGLRKCKARQYLRMFGESRWQQLHTYAFCIGIGPLAGMGAHWITRRFLSTFEHISVRDTVSAEHLSNLGIPNVRVVTDPVIGLVDILQSRKQRDSKTLGIVVRSWSRGPNVAGLISSLQSAAQNLRKLGWKVQFISFQPQNDTEVIQLLRNKDEDMRGWMPEKETIPDFCKYLSGFQVLVTMRAHGVFVSSLLGGVPIAVRIEPKLEISAVTCGYPDYIIPLESSPEEIVNMVTRASVAGPTIHNWQDDVQALEAESNRLCDWLRT